ncbi:hypothetical protein ACF1G0_23110 [Streptomyces sp. NPDC013953]|uniref:hypothetical protein n=1 Tax=Streptomyces sp. NPDC013953 TaxID=3364868 RepID=UPI0036FBD3E9
MITPGANVNEDARPDLREVPTGAGAPGHDPVAPAWPVWRPDYPRHAPSREPYLLAALRMTAPSGRVWQQHRLIENANLRVRLVPLLGTLPLSHSLLQEPHGGQPCRFLHSELRIWRDPDPDRWPNTLYRQFVEDDGFRRGLGEITLTLRLLTPEGHRFVCSRTISECNIRADGRLLLTQVPERVPER